MNIFKSLKSLFYPTPIITSSRLEPVDPIPTAPAPKISCFVEGIAKVWKDGEGWTVKRSKPKWVTPNINVYATGISSYVPSPYQTRDVELSHVELGIKILLTEYVANANISINKLLINGEDMWHWVSARESSYLHETIRQNAYIPLKQRLAKQAKEGATRAENLKKIKALGCPVTSQTVTMTEAEMLRDPA